MSSKLLLFEPNKKRSETYYKKLSKEDRNILDKFEDYCKVGSGEARSRKAKTNALRFVVMSKKKIKDIKLEDLHNFLKVLKQEGVKEEEKLSDYSKNDMKGFVRRFLKWHFKDWSVRFNNFEEVVFDNNAVRKEKILPEDILSKEEVLKLVKAERDLNYKTFILVQYNCALRTKEVRELMWKNIDMKDSEVWWLKIYSKKNKLGKPVERFAPPIDKETIQYLKEIKKEQEENEVVSPYVFPSTLNKDNPISSGAVSQWFSRLTKKVLGKKKKNYMLRHSKGEEFHKLVRAGKMSKENATLMLGHSERMFDKTYSHTQEKELKKVLMEQSLNVDFIPEEKRGIVEKLQTDMKVIKKMLKVYADRLEKLESNN